jgi:hypothetical protein
MSYGLQIPFETVLGFIPGTRENKLRKLEAAKAEMEQQLLPMEQLWRQQAFQAMHPALLEQVKVLGNLGLGKESLATEAWLKSRALDTEEDRLSAEREYRQGLLEQGRKELGLREEQLRQGLMEMLLRNQLGQNELALRERLGRLPFEQVPKEWTERNVPEMLSLLFGAMNNPNPAMGPVRDYIMERLGIPKPTPPTPPKLEGLDEAAKGVSGVEGLKQGLKKASQGLLSNGNAFIFGPKPGDLDPGKIREMFGGGLPPAGQLPIPTPPQGGFFRGLLEALGLREKQQTGKPTLPGTIQDAIIEGLKKNPRRSEGSNSDIETLLKRLGLLNSERI